MIRERSGATMITGHGPIHRSSDWIDHRSPPMKKIALFRSLFRGREDIYPRRFESRKTGKTGYQPACANEWARGICEKPSVLALTKGFPWTRVDASLGHDD
jgi:hypothetical protein